MDILQSIFQLFDKISDRVLTLGKKVFQHQMKNKSIVALNFAVTLPQKSIRPVNKSSTVFAKYFLK